MLLHLFYAFVLSFFFSSWLAAVCDRGIHWTFLLPFVRPKDTRRMTNSVDTDQAVT